MNRRVWCCVGLLSVITWFARSSPAQQAPAAAGAAGTVIPLGAPQAPDATEFQPKIHQFVVEQFGFLGSEKPAVRDAARDKLVAGCPRGASPSYAAIFGKEVNLQAGALLGVSKPMPVRLNVAIVLSAVANNGATMEVEPQVRALLEDHDAPVAYWAVKASAPLVAQLIQGPQFAGNKLVPALIDCVKKHANTDPLSGAIAEDVYKALTPTEIQGLNGPQLKTAALPLVGPVLDLIEFRCTLHARQLVPSPNAEKAACTFLAQEYPSMTPDVQQRTMQDLVTLVTDLGQRAADYAAPANTPKGSAVKVDVMSAVRSSLKTAASALDVVCGNPAIHDGVQWLDQIPPSATAAEILTHTATVPGTVQNVYNYIKAPAALPALPTTAPAVAPAPAPVPAPPAAA